MTYTELETKFNVEKDSFHNMKQNIEEKITTSKYSLGEYFNILPFSYQRLGLQKGKIIEDKDKIKSFDNVYIYGFDKEDKLIEIKEGIEIKNHFYHQFFIYDETSIVSYRYTNSNDLQNISYYFVEKDKNRIIKVLSKGRRGGRREQYVYSDDNLLIRIDVMQIDRKGNELNPFKEIFNYDSANELKSITKVFENGDTDTVYKSI